MSLKYPNMKNYILQHSLHSIGHALMRLRYARNEKQQTVAQATGISIAVLSKIECGKYPHVTIECLLKLTEYYAVTLADLMDPEVRA